VHIFGSGKPYSYIIQLCSTSYIIQPCSTSYIIQACSTYIQRHTPHRLQVHRQKPSPIHHSVGWLHTSCMLHTYNLQHAALLNLHGSCMLHTYHACFTLNLHRSCMLHTYNLHAALLNFCRSCMLHTYNLQHAALLNLCPICVQRHTPHRLQVHRQQVCLPRNMSGSTAPVLCSAFVCAYRKAVA
jgi:hypothetical protein